MFDKMELKLIIVAVVLFLVAFTGFCSMSRISSGYKGVYTLWGKVEESRILDEGMHFSNPFARIIKVDVRIKKLELTLLTYTHDLQQADLQIVVTYAINPEAVAKLYKYVGLNDFESKLVSPITYTSLKNVIGKWEADKLVGNREQAVSEVNTILRESLDNKYIIFQSFDLINIDYSDAFEKAIEEKQIATQQAIKEKNNTVKVQEIANQKIISAKAEAEAMTIKTRALSNNKSLVEYEAVQKWDGKLPTTTSGVIPFINIK